MNTKFLVKLIVYLISALRSRAAHLDKGITEDTDSIAQLMDAREEKNDEKDLSLKLAHNIDKLLK